MSIKMTEGLATPWTKPWLTDGLESVSHCPVCGDTNREILHSDLIDNVFRVAPGKWALWKCAKCSGTYLDPRPNQATIHLAYANYYTHQEVLGKDDYGSLSQLRKLRRRLVNGYTNWRYGTHAVPSTAYGVVAAFAMPMLKKVIDHQYRHLPRLPKGGGRLLDVGCGNGSFLELARTCGWDVVGLDPDSMAAANAAKQGLTVHEGGIEYFAGKTALFDVITMNHVIEHVHDPVKVLEACQALLKPGGQLWLDTPNIDSFGHAWFQKSWRGLETPRHLVLFNRSSLGQALLKAGFSVPKYRTRPSPCAVTFQASFAMEHDHDPYQAMAFPTALKLRVAIAGFMQGFMPARREFLTVTVRRSDA